MNWRLIVLSLFVQNEAKGQNRVLQKKIMASSSNEKSSGNVISDVECFLRVFETPYLVPLSQIKHFLSLYEVKLYGEFFDLTSFITKLSKTAGNSAMRARMKKCVNDPSLFTEIRESTTLGFLVHHKAIQHLSCHLNGKKESIRNCRSLFSNLCKYIIYPFLTSKNSDANAVPSQNSRANDANIFQAKDYKKFEESIEKKKMGKFSMNIQGYEYVFQLAPQKLVSEFNEKNRNSYIRRSFNYLSIACGYESPDELLSVLVEFPQNRKIVYKNDKIVKKISIDAQETMKKEMEQSFDDNILKIYKSHKGVSDRNVTKLLYSLFYEKPVKNDVPYQPFLPSYFLDCGWNVGQVVSEVIEEEYGGDFDLVWWKVWLLVEERLASLGAGSSESKKKVLKALGDETVGKKYTKYCFFEYVISEVSEFWSHDNKEELKDQVKEARDSGYLDTIRPPSIPAQALEMAVPYILGERAYSRVKRKKTSLDVRFPGGPKREKIPEKVRERTYLYTDLEDLISKIEEDPIDIILKKKRTVTVDEGGEAVDVEVYSRSLLACLHQRFGVAAKEGYFGSTTAVTIAILPWLDGYPTQKKNIISGKLSIYFMEDGEEILNNPRSQQFFEKPIGFLESIQPENRTNSVGCVLTLMDLIDEIGCQSLVIPNGEGTTTITLKWMNIYIKADGKMLAFIWGYNSSGKKKETITDLDLSLPMTYESIITARRLSAKDQMKMFVLEQEEDMKSYGILHESPVYTNLKKKMENEEISLETIDNNDMNNMCLEVRKSGGCFLHSGSGDAEKQLKCFMKEPDFDLSGYLAKAKELLKREYKLENGLNCAEYRLLLLKFPDSLLPFIKYEKDQAELILENFAMMIKCGYMPFGVWKGNEKQMCLFSYKWECLSRNRWGDALKGLYRVQNVLTIPLMSLEIPPSWAHTEREERENAEDARILNCCSNNHPDNMIEQLDVRNHFETLHITEAPLSTIRNRNHAKQEIKRMLEKTSLHDNFIPKALTEGGYETGYRNLLTTFSLANIMDENSDGVTFHFDGIPFPLKRVSILLDRDILQEQKEKKDGEKCDVCLKNKKNKKCSNECCKGCCTRMPHGRSCKAHGTHEGSDLGDDEAGFDPLLSDIAVPIVAEPLDGHSRLSRFEREIMEVDENGNLVLKDLGDPDRGRNNATNREGNGTERIVVQHDSNNNRSINYLDRFETVETNNNNNNISVIQSGSENSMRRRVTTHSELDEVFERMSALWHFKFPLEPESGTFRPSHFLEKDYSKIAPGFGEKTFDCYLCGICRSSFMSTGNIGICKGCLCPFHKGDCGGFEMCDALDDGTKFKSRCRKCQQDRKYRSINNVKY